MPIPLTLLSPKSPGTPESPGAKHPRSPYLFQSSQMHASGTVDGLSPLGKLPSVSIAPCLGSPRISLFLLRLHHAPLFLPSPSRDADPRALSLVTTLVIQGSFLSELHLPRGLNMHSAKAWPGPSSELLALAPLLPPAYSPGISNPVSANGPSPKPSSACAALPSLEKGLPLIRNYRR